ncbi:MAG: hypothetical protein RXS19_04465 [Caldisphaera sp.]
MDNVNKLILHYVNEPYKIHTILKAERLRIGKNIITLLSKTNFVKFYAINLIELIKLQCTI